MAMKIPPMTHGERNVMMAKISATVSLARLSSCSSGSLASRQCRLIALSRAYEGLSENYPQICRNLDVFPVDLRGFLVRNWHSSQRGIESSCVHKNIVYGI